MKRRMIIGAALAVAGMMPGWNKLVAAEYRNDFSARTSKVRGMGGWLSMPYANGAVAYNFDETKFWPTLPYEDASKVQDGWVKARLNAGGAAADGRLFHVFVDRPGGELPHAVDLFAVKRPGSDVVAQRARRKAADEGQIVEGIKLIHVRFSLVWYLPGPGML